MAQIVQYSVSHQSHSQNTHIPYVCLSLLSFHFPCPTNQSNELGYSLTLINATLTPLLPVKPTAHIQYLYLFNSILQSYERCGTKQIFHPPSQRRISVQS
jgi:hypothetical protein